MEERKNLVKVVCCPDDTGDNEYDIFVSTDSGETREYVCGDLTDYDDITGSETVDVKMLRVLMLCAKLGCILVDEK
ncbi:MAG: hypothetical protein II936_05485 [Oscillospiraceae bacterium]|nr:hypothetical protein [Oscillospiraceae bacterium]